MKMRNACLAALPVMVLPLMFCMGSPPSGPKVPEVLATAGSTGQGSAAGAASWSSVGPANFPHEKHVTEFDVQCVQCHHETNAKPLSMPHESYFKDSWSDCTVCHRKAGSEALEPQACSACHHAQSGDVSDETLSAKVVIHKSCWTCHEVGTGASASAACKTCHTPRS